IIDSIKGYVSINQMLDIIVGPERIVILLALPVQWDVSMYKMLAIQHAKRLKKNINQQTSYSVTIGIGNYYEDDRNLHLSYQEGIHAQSYRLFSGKNTIIHIDEIEPLSQETTFLYREEIKVMSNKLSVGDFVGVKNSWKTIMNDISTITTIPPKTFCFHVLDILFSLTKSAIDGGASSQEVIPLQLEFAKELLEVETLEQISSWMEEVVDCYAEQILAKHNEQMLKSIQKALKYMNADYTEDDSLETVAQHVRLSVNYFSTTF